MAEIRSLKSVAEKWSRITPGRTEDYKIGVKNPRRDWEEETIAAKDTWKQGIDAAHRDDLFGKGVKKAGTDKWQDRALKVGPSRFAEGVFIAGEDYEKGFAPYHDAIEAVDLPPRFPARDPRNLARVKAIVDALITEKLGK